MSQERTKSKLYVVPVGTIQNSEDEDLSENPSVLEAAIDYARANFIVQ